MSRWCLLSLLWLLGGCAHKGTPQVQPLPHECGAIELAELAEEGGAIFHLHLHPQRRQLGEKLAVYLGPIGAELPLYLQWENDAAMVEALAAGDPLKLAVELAPAGTMNLRLLALSPPCESGLKLAWQVPATPTKPEVEVREGRIELRIPQDTTASVGIWRRDIKTKLEEQVEADWDHLLPWVDPDAGPGSLFAYSLVNRYPVEMDPSASRPRWLESQRGPEAYGAVPIPQPALLSPPGIWRLALQWQRKLLKSLF